MSPEHPTQSGERGLAESVARLFGAIVVATDGEFRVASWNEHFAALCGGDPERMRGRAMAEVLAPDEAEVFTAALATLERGQNRNVGTHRFRRLTGDAPEIEWCVAWPSDPPGEATGLLCIGRNVKSDTSEKCAHDEVEARSAHALAESEKRFRRMGETMREVFFIASADRKTVHYVNQAFERIWGIPREALYADSRIFLQTIHPEDRASMASTIAEQKARGDSPINLEIEYRIVRPDGGIRWVVSRTYPVLGGDGTAPTVVGLVADITARKQAEQALRERTAELERLLREKHALLAEVHHRVKNNLQSISGLMHMMAANAHRRPIGETVEEIERRIQTIALVHEMLYRSASLADVDMQAYLQRIAAAQSSMAESSPGDVDIRVQAAPGVTLDLDGAIRCGLIVNELVGNSIKHAFPRRSGGRIEVSMERRGERHFVLRVADDGTGFPDDLDFTSESTLGLRLVAGLADQLGGAARRAGQSAIEIEFPVTL